MDDQRPGETAKGSGRGHGPDDVPHDPPRFERVAHSGKVSDAARIASAGELIVRGLIAGVTGTAQHDPQLATILEEQIYRPLSGHNRERIRAGQERGQLKGLDPHVLEDLLIAPMWYRLLVINQPISRDYADAVLSAVVSASNQ